MSDIGLVIYSDGGKDTTSDAAGWGLHGYSYTVLEEKKTKFTKSKASYGQYGYVNGNKIDTTFGLGERRVVKGGLFKLVVDDPDSMPSQPVTPIDYYDYYGPVPGATSQLVEVIAMHQALDLIIATKAVQAVVITDSEYVCKSLTMYINQWVKNGWVTAANQPVKNKSHWVAIWDKFNQLRNDGVIVRIGWTKGHLGEPGNELADANATRGKIAVYNKLDGECRVRPVSGAAPKARTCNRLLEQRWWYSINNAQSNSHKIFPGRHVYFLGNHGKEEKDDDIIGKYTSTAKIGILVTPTPEPVLELLSEYLQDTYYDSVGLVTLGNLENITEKKRYVDLLTGGLKSLLPRTRNHSICTPDGITVLKELRPTYHAFRLLDVLCNHADLIHRFEDKCPYLQVTEVTDLLYTDVEVGNKKKKWVKKLTPLIDNTRRELMLDIKYACMDNKGTRKVPFIKGQDIPTRNTLNALIETEKPIRVYAITWQRSSTEFRYGTIVTVGEDTLLTCSLRSNLVPLVGVTRK